MSITSQWFSISLFLSLTLSWVNDDATVFMQEWVSCICKQYGHPAASWDV
jgi:hypothetical protein